MKQKLPLTIRSSRDFFEFLTRTALLFYLPSFAHFMYHLAEIPNTHHYPAESSALRLNHSANEKYVCPSELVFDGTRFLSVRTSLGKMKDLVTMDRKYQNRPHSCGPQFQESARSSQFRCAKIYLTT